MRAIRVESAVDARDRWLGAELDGKYEVLERIGAGAMSVVYRARRIGTDELVAIKRLRVPNDELAERFRREALAVSRLTSGNVVRIYDVGELEARPWIAMELLVGMSLDEALADGPIEAGRVLWIIGQVCNALEEAHALGVIHRDIKPANIFIDTKDGFEVVKVVDFGIAKLTERSGLADRALTQVGAIMGTPTYMSPEQAAGGTLDHRSDIYALGAVAYHGLAGRPPFLGSSSEVMFAHRHKAPLAFSALDPPVAPINPGLETLVMRMLAKQPERRPANTSALRYQAEALVHAAEPIARPQVASRARRFASFAVAAVLVLVASGALAWTLTP